MATNISNNKKRVRLWDDSVVIDNSDSEDEFELPDSPQHTRSGKHFGSEDGDLVYLNSLHPDQKKFLLEEELRLNKSLNQDVPLKWRILQLDAPDKIKGQALSFIRRHADDPENNSNCLTAAEKICEIPWGKFHTVDLSGAGSVAKILEDSYSTMNREVYGQEPAKLEIVEYLSSVLSNRNSARVLGLYGPPGIGKTTLIKNALSRALGDRPFYYISLGGADDACFLNGSRPVWKGAQQGRLVDALVETKCMNPIIYFDELDKVSHTERGESIYKFLVHLTDPEQNKEIYDSFLNTSLDLSGALFVFSYNYRDKINCVPLLERIKEIRLEGFSPADKLTIARDYVIPRTAKQFNMDHTEIAIFNDKSINYVNSLAKPVEGVRPINEIYQTLFSKILTANIINTAPKNSSNLLSKKYQIGNFKLPLKITPKIIDSLFNI